MAIDYQKRDGVAYIMLNNPAKANILDRKTSDEIPTRGSTWGRPPRNASTMRIAAGGFKREGYSSARNAWHTYDSVSMIRGRSLSN